MDVGGDSWTIDATIRGGIGRFAWSPDSKWILYVNNQQDPGLYIVPVDASGTPIRALSGEFGEVAWSPDGQKIAYTTWGSVRTN